MGAVMILDATKPAPPVQYPQRARPPRDKVREVRLEGLLEPFDPARLRGDYRPTGFAGLAGRPGAVPGHRFGLALGDADRNALIAFLKTL
jgi:hypothetical protein